MTHKRKMISVDAQIFIRRIAQKCERRGHIFNAVIETECPFRPPGAAIMKEQRVPARPADRLRQIKIFFIARKTVQHDHGRMWARPVSEIDMAIHPVAMGIDPKLEDRRREFLINGCRVLGDSGNIRPYWSSSQPVSIIAPTPISPATVKKRIRPSLTSMLRTHR